MHQNSNFNDQLRLHIIVFIWGFTAILGDLISKEALELVWNRILITLVVIVAYFLIKNISFNIDRKALGKMAFAGILIAAHWWTFFHAIKISNVSITLVCLSSGAFFTSLLEPIFYKRRLLLYELLLGLVVVAAIAMIFTVETDYLWGILTALLSAFLSASFSIINGKLTLEHSSETITFYELASGWLALTVALLFTGGISISTFPEGTSDWVYLIILGSVCTAYPFIETVRIMRHLSPFTVILSINMEPVYGIILAYFLLGEKEKMTPAFYGGAVLIIAVIFTNAFISKRLKNRKAQAVR